MNLNDKSMKPKYSHQQIASDVILWKEYVDTTGLNTDQHFNSMTLEQRLEFMRQCFGPDRSKQAAVEKLVAAGYHAYASDDTLFVEGDGWTASFSELGQDHDVFSGDVPVQVHELAVWDDPDTRVS